MSPHLVHQWRTSALQRNVCKINYIFQFSWFSHNYPKISPGKNGDGTGCGGEIRTFLDAQYFAADQGCAAAAWTAPFGLSQIPVWYFFSIIRIYSKSANNLIPPVWNWPIILFSDNIVRGALTGSERASNIRTHKKRARRKNICGKNWHSALSMTWSWHFF